VRESFFSFAVRCLASRDSYFHMLTHKDDSFVQPNQNTFDMHNHNNKNNNNNISRNDTEQKAFLAEAHTDFQHSVTNGISKLRESGFSKQRAIEILLKFIRQQDDVPKDDEVSVLFF